METKKIIDLEKNPGLEIEIQKLKEALNKVAEKLQETFSPLTQTTEKAAKNSIYGSRIIKKVDRLRDERNEIKDLIDYLEKFAKNRNIFASEIIMDKVEGIFCNLFLHEEEGDFIVPTDFDIYREMLRAKEFINGYSFDSRNWLIDVLHYMSEFYFDQIYRISHPNEVKTYCENKVDSTVKLHHDNSSVIPNLTKDATFDSEDIQFSSGAKRENKVNKGRCDLLPASALLRLAIHYERGAERYGDRNWEDGLPIKSFIDSGLRHILKYMAGYDDEDHLAAAAWNLVGAMWTEDNHDEETAPGLELRTKRGVDRDHWNYLKQGVRECK